MRTFWITVFVLLVFGLAQPASAAAAAEVPRGEERAVTVEVGVSSWWAAVTARGEATVRAVHGWIVALSGEEAADDDSSSAPPPPLDETGFIINPDG